MLFRSAEIMATLNIDWIQHVSQEHWNPDEAGPFMAGLPEVVRGFAGCDLLIYQAGADPHINDPLGGFLSTQQLVERDRIVFSIAKTIGVPVVWNLAGGYQEPLSRVLDIHRNTLFACAAEYV